MARESQRSEPLKWLIVLLLFVIDVWALYLVSMLHLSGRWDTLSNFGQSFGAVDALFSGLAFAGLIYAILLQRKELQLQREAQERSEASLKQQSKTMLLTARLNIMASIIQLRRERQNISRDVQELGLMHISGVNPEQLNAFIEEMEHELAAVNQELQQGEDTPHAS